MRANRPALRRRQGGIACDPGKLSQGRAGAVDAPLHPGNDPVHRPAGGCDAPTWATNEQIMAWMMDTYSVYMARRSQAS